MSRTDRVRRRFWIEAGLATVTGLLAILTSITAEWIEAIFGVDPDGGDGSLEWLLVVALAVVCVAFSVMARAEWRRPVTA